MCKAEGPDGPRKAARARPERPRNRERAGLGRYTPEERTRLEALLEHLGRLLADPAERRSFRAYTLTPLPPCLRLNSLMPVPAALRTAVQTRGGPVPWCDEATRRDWKACSTRRPILWVDGVVMLCVTLPSWAPRPTPSPTGRSAALSHRL